MVPITTTLYQYEYGRIIVVGSWDYTTILLSLYYGSNIIIIIIVVVIIFIIIGMLCHC